MCAQVDGGDLFDILSKLSERGEPDSNNNPIYRMEEQRAKPMFRDLLNAVDFMHSKGVSALLGNL